MKNKLIKAILSFQLSDVLLFIFFILLLSQSAFNMLTGVLGSEIDVFIRTSSAAIFGYFISSRFINTDDTSSGASAVSKISLNNTSSGIDSMRSQIGFSINDDNTTENTQGNITTQTPDETSSKKLMQIIVIGLIGLICLIFMLIFRNLEFITNRIDNESSILFISQMRDFFAGSVGFLIAYPKK